MLTAERLREVLDYDPETGLFRWKVRTSNRCKQGWFGGTRDYEGYRLTQVDGVFCRSHRLAWFWFYGEWPPRHIDHVNGIRDDNRIVNLRLATQSENNANTGLNKFNSTGVKGVCFDSTRQKFRATITVNGCHINLGRFETIEEARIVYQQAAEKHFGQFARFD